MKLFKLLLVFILFNISSCYKPVQKPADFDEFWKTSVSELGNEIDVRTIKDTVLGSKELSLKAIESYQDITIYAWVSIPKKPGKYPVFINFFGFGKGNPNKDEPSKKWFLSQKDHINIVVDIRGQGLSTDKIKFKGYLTKGLEDKNTFIYKGAYLDAVKIVDYAHTIPEGDGNIIVKGGSQGGALAIAATALNPKVTMCISNFPFLTDMLNYDKTKWPMKIWIHEAKMKEWKLEELHETLSYFDALNFADNINVPVFMRTQETDTITPKETAVKLFNSIKNKNKKIYIDPCNGHGCSSVSKEANSLEHAFIKKNLINF